MRTLRVLSMMVVGVGLVVQLTGSAHAERRVALVIGNSAYQNVAALKNPVNDASLIAAALKTDGFVVTLADDLGHEGLLKALRSFRNEVDGADWAVVYYAGHGIEMGDENYLIPVDARLAEDRDVADETVSLDRVMAAVESARDMKMVVLDACRNNPFLASMKTSAGAGRDIGRGLALVEPQQAALVAFSAKAGSIAADGDDADSPFASALSKRLTESGVEVDKMFRLVRDDVLDATRKKQEPFVYGSLPGRQDFYFRPAIAAAPPLAAPPAAGNGNDPMAADYQVTAAVGTLAAWDLFLKKHGAEADNFYVGLAKENQLKLQAKPPQTPDVPPAGAAAATPQESVVVDHAPVGGGNLGVDEVTPADSGTPSIGAAKLAAVEPGAEQPADAAAVARKANAGFPDGGTSTGGAPVVGPVAALPSPAAPAEAAKSSPDLIRNIQRELVRVGCVTGSADGVWGRKGQSAAATFARYAKVTLASLDPSEDLLSTLKSQSGRVCPLVCGAQYEAKGDTCVLKTCSKGMTLNSSGSCSAPLSPLKQAAPAGASGGRKGGIASASGGGGCQLETQQQCIGRREFGINGNMSTDRQAQIEQDCSIPAKRKCH